MAIDNKDKKVLKSSIEREQNEVACSAECEKIKGSKNLNVPPLRFPEFSGEWEKRTLEDVSEFSKERMNTQNLSSDNYVATENMLHDYQGIIEASSVPTNTNVIKFNKGDVLLSNIRPYLKKVWFADKNGGCSADVFVFKALSACIPDFLHYIIANDRFINFAMSGAKGVKMPRGDKEQMKTYEIGLPSIEEQKKIAKLLSLLDERITTQNKIIYKLKSLIRGIMVELQKRGLSNGTWKKVLLSNVLTERNELNKSLYPVYSVSVIQGIVNQMEYLGRSFAASDTSKYHVVHYGDLVYTKSPTGSFPYGIIKQSYNQNEVAVSPLYGVYEPKTFSTGVFLHEYFKSELNTLNYLHPLVQKGAKNTINIANQRFLESYVAIPSNANELLAISKLLCSLNTKLEFLQNILKQSQGQKQYLLRQMFI